MLTDSGYKDSMDNEKQLPHHDKWIVVPLGRKDKEAHVYEDAVKTRIQWFLIVFVIYIAYIYHEATHKSRNPSISKIEGIAAEQNG